MVERDEGRSRILKKSNGNSDAKPQTPTTFVNQFAKFMESKVSYAQVVQQGQNELSRAASEQIGSDSSKFDADIHRSQSTPSFDSLLVSTTSSLSHSISSPALEIQAFESENSSDYSSSSSSSTNTPNSTSTSTTPLYFGRLKSKLSLPKNWSSEKSTSTHLKTNTSKNGKPPQSNSDIAARELQRLVKRAMDSGRLRRQCIKCGSLHHCCGQTILEAVSSLSTSS